MKDKNSNIKVLPPEQQAELLHTLKVRFEKNMERHKELEWTKVQRQSSKLIP
jgi:hypothetical protein